MSISALEREIIEKFQQLQPTAQQRVLALMEETVGGGGTQESPFDYEGWVHQVEALRQQILASHASADVVGLLRDIRDGEDE